MGTIGRFWRPSADESLATIRTPQDFVAFDEPGFAKAALSFTVAPEGSGARIVTKTRVAGTSAEATRLFRRYWLVIGWGSAAIRRSWLRGIRRRVERHRT